METELVKMLQLKYPTISYMNKLYEGNKKTLTQTLHNKMLKLLCKIKKKICLQQATNLALLRKLLWSYFVMIIRMQEMLHYIENTRISQKNQNKVVLFLHFIVSTRISTPIKNSTPFFLAMPPFKSVNCPSL